MTHLDADVFGDPHPGLDHNANRPNLLSWFVGRHQQAGRPVNGKRVT
jgi:hypothetical protein